MNLVWDYNMPPKKDTGKEKPASISDQIELEHQEEISHLQRELDAALTGTISAETRAIQAKKQREDDVQLAKT